MPQANTEKLQKVLARAGLGSRRELETWIAAGRVSVNGSRVQLGVRVGERDVIRVDGRIINARQSTAKRVRVLRYHKPIGEVCTRHDEQGRRTVFESLPRGPNARWLSVGRLDIATTGLLLFTNEGELAHGLTHPSMQFEREYIVRVYGEVTQEVTKRLREGVTFDDGVARFHAIVPLGGDGRNAWYRVILHSGKNREVRRLWESQGLGVSRLTRIRFGPVSLRRGLPPGRWDELREHDVNALRGAAGLSPREPEPARSNARAKVITTPKHQKRAGKRRPWTT